MRFWRKQNGGGASAMTERRTYLDANGLIAAWNGDDEARAIRDDLNHHTGKQSCKP
jgi:hypothetical protein